MTGEVINFKVNAAEVIAAINQKVYWALAAGARGLEKGMHYVESDIVRAQMTGRKSPDYGLNRQTGALSKAHDVRMSITKDDVQATLQFGFPNAPYTPYHQRGGRVTSRGKMFTVPLNDKARKSRPADWPNLFFMKGRASGKALLMNKVDDFTIEPMWLLTRTINIPKRLYIIEEFKAFRGQRVFDTVASELYKSFTRHASVRG
jgi:hypothetical protein